MFGISAAELFVVLLVGVIVIPVKNWPDVAKFLAQCVKFIRGIIWKISDASEQIRDRIDREMPINGIIQSTTNDVLDSFSTLRPKKSAGKKRAAKK